MSYSHQKERTSFKAIPECNLGIWISYSLINAMYIWDHLFVACELLILYLPFPSHLLQNTPDFVPQELVIFGLVTSAMLASSAAAIVTVVGTDYWKGAVLLSHFECEIHQFALLDTITTVNSDALGIYFILKMMETDGFLSHWNSYCRSDTVPTKWFFAQPSELSDYTPLHLPYPSGGRESLLKLLCLR
jgi:hypothetical protein